jgi:hypothetical protein
MKLAPNFEMAMYLAQATGSCIITDSLIRWQEIKRAIQRRNREPTPDLSALAHSIQDVRFAFPQHAHHIMALAQDATFATYPALMRDVIKYLSRLSELGAKPNVEANLNARFARAHLLAQATIKKASIIARESRISCAFPAGGIQDNSVNRLLLMSSSERYLQSVPMAFFIEREDTGESGQLGQKG